MAAKKKEQTIREQMLLALLPQVDLNHAHSSAQSIQKAVDEIMEVWGFE